MSSNSKKFTYSRFLHSTFYCWATLR
ncbi:hypothetical protein [Microcoleus vaginatus]